MTCQFANGDCGGRLEWHHVVKQQRLRREFKYGAHWGHYPRWQPVDRHARVEESSPLFKTLDDILGDTRNRVFLCHHHHELVTNGRLKVDIPESAWEFAREFGLEGMLENDLRRAA